MTSQPYSAGTLVTGSITDVSKASLSNWACSSCAWVVLKNVWARVAINTIDKQTNTNWDKLAILYIAPTSRGSSSKFVQFAHSLRLNSDDSTSYLTLEKDRYYHVYCTAGSSYCIYIGYDSTVLYNGAATNIIFCTYGQGSSTMYVYCYNQLGTGTTIGSSYYGIYLRAYSGGGGVYVAYT